VKKLILGFLALLLIVAVVATPSLERHAAARIGNRIPADTLVVSFWTVNVDWMGMDWKGITAEKASLNVPYLAAARHFWTGQPVTAGRISATNAVADLNHEQLKSIRSLLGMGGIRRDSIQIYSAVMNGHKTETGYHVVASDVRTDLGRFRYQGDIENLRFTNGTLHVTEIDKILELLYINMAVATQGTSERISGGISITW
jgi:hypothetical protein